VIGSIVPRCFCWGLILCLIVTACEKESEPIDKEYIESEAYKNFKKNSNNNFSEQINGYESLHHYLQKFEPCAKALKLSLPLHIDKNMLQRNAADFGKECEVPGTGGISPYNMQDIGYTSLKQITIRWIILEKESIYEDQQLLAVAYKDSVLSDFKIIGKFQKNLSQKISSDIQVSQRGELVYINTTMRRNILYPIEQKNITETNYRINSNGDIRKQ
jgi:hypothetical protein